jgi:translocation and assembly module TamA
MKGQTAPLRRLSRVVSVALLAFCAAAAPVRALDRLEVATPGADEALRAVILDASLLKRTAEGEEREDAAAVLAAARSDYQRILAALYDAGYFGPSVSIRIDGREAAAIPPLDAPARISVVQMTVAPGPVFRFGTARIGPLPDGTAPPEAFRTGAPARTGAIRDAAEAAVEAWRGTGHAKARVAGDRITADHPAERVNAEVAIDPGPRLRFGGLSFDGRSRVRPERLREIAGFPEGAVFSPEEVERVAERLRRTGTFGSVAMDEAEEANPDGTLDVTATVIDRKPRRFGVGAELSSTEGLSASAYWLHRNAFGGAERLRFDARVSGIGGGSGGMDYLLEGRLSRPATLSPDSTGFSFARLEQRTDPGFFSQSAEVGAGIAHYFSDELTGEVALALRYANTRSAMGAREFLLLTLPLDLRWDRRDDPLDATRGFYLHADATPYLGLNGTQSGVRLKLDGAAYFSLGERTVIAARGQLGSVLGSSIAGTPPDYLFFSGGGGTVRGHAFQSLGVTAGASLTGGRSFAGGSLELRQDFGSAFGGVLFYDVGYVGASSLPDGTGGLHSGAGIGIRYDTGIGPIRLDVATPVTGPITGGRVHVYLGIGHSF